MIPIIYNNAYKQIENNNKKYMIDNKESRLFKTKLHDKKIYKN